MNSLLRNAVSLMALTMALLAPTEAFAGYYYSRTTIRHTTYTTTRTVPAPVAQVVPVRQVAVNTCWGGRCYRPCRVVRCRPCCKVVFRRGCGRRCY